LSSRAAKEAKPVPDIFTRYATCYPKSKEFFAVYVRRRHIPPFIRGEYMGEGWSAIQKLAASYEWE